MNGRRKYMQKNPNVILIFVDDLGYGDISSFNENGKIHTPNIDALASNGMRFTDSHACSPLCAPSRYGLLTGRYNFRSKLKAFVLAGDSPCLIEKDRMTLPMLFKNHGYHTSCVGKWHLGLEWQSKDEAKPSDYALDPALYDNIPERAPFEPIPAPPPGTPDRVEGLDIDYTKPFLYGPCQYGFDYFFGMTASLDQPPYAYIENDHLLSPLTKLTGMVGMDRKNPDHVSTWQYGLSAEDFDHTSTLDVMNDKVLSLIDDYTQTEDPFFIYYPTPAVHTPHLPNEKFKGKSGLNAYCDVVLQLDDMVGQIADKLKDKGVLEDTVIIFTSDNGCSPAVNYPFLLEHGHNPSYNFRSHKGSMYEGGHRVPTFVHYPAQVKAGSVCDANVCHTDFFNTFAELLGDKSITDTTAEDSFSNLPLWRGEGEIGRKATVCNTGAGFLGLTKGDYKLLCCSGGGTSKACMDSVRSGKLVPQKFELFNLTQDIGETTDVYDQHPEIVAEMLCELNRIFDDGRSTPGAVQSNYVPECWPQINFKPEN